MSVAGYSTATGEDHCTANDKNKQQREFQPEHASSSLSENMAHAGLGLSDCLPGGSSTIGDDVRSQVASTIVREVREVGCSPARNGLTKALPRGDLAHPAVHQG